MLFQLATAFMLAHPYGVPRVMSSFEYNRANDYEGPPHNGDMSIKTVTLSGLACTGGWSCEHRYIFLFVTMCDDVDMTMCDV